MEKVVYLLGAGFSAPLNIPVMSNFLIKSKDLFASKIERYKHFDKVFKTIDKLHKVKSYCQADLLNIEEILSILEMQKSIGGVRKQDFVKFISDVISSYSPVFPSKILRPGQDWQHKMFRDIPLVNTHYCFFVGNLLNLIITAKGDKQQILEIQKNIEASVSYSVITVNYDTVLEDIGRIFTEYNPNIKFLRNLSSNQNQEGSHTYLAKLHGSVDTEDIVPPTWNKSLRKKIQPAWKLAYKLLGEANYLRVIGYSLPISDTYIKYLLKSSLIETQNLKKIEVLCYDPDGSVKQRYDEFFDFNYYNFLDVIVENYLKNIFDEHSKSFGSYPVFGFNVLEKTHQDFIRNPYLSATD